MLNNPIRITSYHSLIKAMKKNNYCLCRVKAGPSTDITRTHCQLLAQTQSDRRRQIKTKENTVVKIIHIPTLYSHNVFHSHPINSLLAENLLHYNGFFIKIKIILSSKLTIFIETKVNLHDLRCDALMKYDVINRLRTLTKYIVEYSFWSPLVQEAL